MVASGTPSERMTARSVPSWVRLHGGSAEWIRNKQRTAEAHAECAMRDGGSPRIAVNLLIGTTTASGRTILPVSWLASLPGASGESRSPGDPMYDRLHDDVAAHGFDHAKAGHIAVYVNHRGRAFIYEGNTRVAVARAHGVASLMVEVQWLNGGEQVDGDASPWALDALARSAEPIPSPQGEWTPDDLAEEEASHRRPRP